MKRFDPHATVLAQGPSARVMVIGGPRTGKTSLAASLRVEPLIHADTLIDAFTWSAVSEELATLMGRPGPWLIEGVAAVRGLRKWLHEHSQGKPCDLVIVMSEAKVGRTPRQEAMAKQSETIFSRIIDELVRRGTGLLEERPGT